MQAQGAYNEGMQYTLRNIPKHLDEALRRKANQESRSLNDVALEALMRAMGLREQRIAHRRLKDVSGTWVEDSKVDEALQAQRQVDPDLWR